MRLEKEKRSEADPAAGRRRSREPIIGVGRRSREPGLGWGGGPEGPGSGWGRGPADPGLGQWARLGVRRRRLNPDWFRPVACGTKMTVVVGRRWGPGQAPTYPRQPPDAPWTCGEASRSCRDRFLALLRSLTSLGASCVEVSSIIHVDFVSVQKGEKTVWEPRVKWILQIVYVCRHK